MSTDPAPMSQTAPFPSALADLVGRVGYKPGWSFSLEHQDRGQGCEGLTLKIIVRGIDSYDHTKPRGVAHWMPVPPAAYLPRDWRRWLFDQIRLVESHETCEFFEVDGRKPFAPNHGAGHDPYTIVEIGTAADAARPPGT